MKPIEEGAKEFVNAPCDWLCVNCATDKMSCRFYNDKESFEAGAEWMHKELTRWHDLEEQPEDGCLCLLKFQSNGFFVHYEGGIFTKKDGEWHDSQNMFTYNRDAILAWRPMHN